MATRKRKSKRISFRVGAAAGPPGLPGRRIPVSIKKPDETWNEITLSDGTVIKTRHIFIEVHRVAGQYGQDGQPIYEIKGGTMIDVKAPMKLRKK